MTAAVACIMASLDEMVNDNVMMLKELIWKGFCQELKLLEDGQGKVISESQDYEVFISRSDDVNEIEISKCNEF